MATIPSHGEPRHSVRRDELALHDDPQREYDEVVARFTNEDGTRKPGWMEAPNGEPTNLTERQWVQVRTPAFKRWFGDWEGDPANASKVVDANGEPLVVYHGTETGGFSVFNGLKNNSSSFGLEGATFFSTSLETAKTYTSSPKAGDFSPFLADAKKWLAKFGAKTQARWLDSHEWHVVDTDKEIKPPKRRIRVEYQVVTENGTFVPNSDGATVAESIRKAERSVANALMSGEGAMVYSCFIRARNPYVVDFKGKTWRGDVVSGTTLDVARKAIEEGSDCAIIKNVEDSASFLSDDNISDSIAVFSPEQIKSATENAGAFDASDPDIRHSVVRGATSGVKEALRHIADGEGHGVIHNAEYGDIEYPLGRTGRHGMGLAHIVESRMAKDGATLDEALDVAIKVASAAESGRTTTERYNTKHLDKDGVRAIVAFMPDGSRIITGYEISADGRGGANRRSPRPESRPHVSLEGIVAALKSKLAEPPTPDIVAQSAPSAQVPDADAFVRDAVMGMLAAAGDGKGAANAGGNAERPTPERASVRRGGSSVRIDDLAIGTLAQRILAGREPTVDDAGKFLAGFGLSRTVNAADALDRARRIADANRERLKAAVERANPEVIGTLARANLADSMQSAMDSLVRGTAQAVDPEIGMRLKAAVAARDRRALMAAKGFTAAEMMARLPVNLAEAVMSVAELERTPGETARREEERKRREEGKAKKGENEAATADADGYTPASDEIEPTDAQKRMVAELLDRAKFANEQAAREDERRKADAERRRAERRDGGDGDDGADGDREGTESALPEATVRRIAPVLTDRWLAAQFLIEWIGDEILKSHPEIPATGEMWKSPVAIRELKQTAVHILRQLAKDTLGSPSLNYARNLADHQINELESDVDTRTYRMVRRRIADVYETIHDNALRISRRRLVSRLIDGWRENGVSHPGIRQLTGARGRFSATTEEMRRRIDGRTEVYARKLIPLLTMSEEKLAAREAELERIVTGSPDETTAPDEETMREARDELAALKKYGGLVRRMPGEIADAADEILTDLGGRRQAFEQRRLEREERLKRTSDTLVAAITDRTAPRRTKPKGRFARFVESYQGNIGLEIRNLFRFCRDESKREAALNETQDVEAALSEAGSVYRTERMRSQAAIGDALKACYGNAAKGIRHLTAERIPDDVAAACFGQNRGQVVTYGNLLQMYASVVQADYAENAREHGRDGQIEMMRNALTDGDVAFYAWAVGWYRDGRKTLSDAVESVTGVPVTSPGENYVPVRVSRPSEGFAADAIAWSPIPRALSRRVPHKLDFDEGAIVTRMRPFSCAGNGILTIP